jgi:S-adenosylmethionine synthetase
MSRRYIFSSESVGEGHPDKVCDTISDAVLDACLAQDKRSRVACETYAKSHTVIVGGEITIPNLPETRALETVVPISKIVRDCVREIGYVNDDDVFHADKIDIQNIITRQSPDIAQGVDARAVEGKDTAEQGAGDQGLMFGYASNETPELMPAPIALAHRLARRLAEARKSGILPYLRPDGKTQVTVRYDGDGRPVSIDKVLISTQHAEGAEDKLPDALWTEVVTAVLPADLYDPVELRQNFYVNPTGRFVVGGPVGDTGLTGRKIIVDTYGGAARHGGGALSGKDPSKVDRSAAYAARHVAKNVVAAGLADRAELQVAYAIGMARPLSLHIDTFGTEKIPRSQILDLVQQNFDLRPAALRDNLNLLRPIYQATAAYGHFGRDEPDFTWEHTDVAGRLREQARLTPSAAATS